jgi:hypothetical protein
MFIPVYLHNLKYDSALFIRELFKNEDDDVSVIASSSENYIAIEKKINLNYNFKFKKKLLYTDTDSLFYHIKHLNIYYQLSRDVNKANQKIWDTTKYSDKNLELYKFNGRFNLYVPGAWKHELANKQCISFCGLAAKSYCYLTNDKKLTQKAKGVTKAASEKLKFNDYFVCIENPDIPIIRKQYVIKANMFSIYTQIINKKSFSGLDTKRHILDNFIDTLPHGHYKINNEKINDKDKNKRCYSSNSEVSDEEYICRN